MKIPRDILLIMVLISFLIGISFGSIFLNINLFWFWAFVILFFILQKLKANFNWQQFLIIILAIFLGFLRIGIDFLFDHTQSLVNYVSMPIEIEAKLIAEPDLRPNKQFLLLDADKIFYQDLIIEARGLIRVTQPKWLNYQYGQTLKVFGEMKLPENNEDFAYADYLAKDSVFVIMPEAKINILSSEINWWNLAEVFEFSIIEIRKFLTKILFENLNEPGSSIVAGLLMGLRANIPEDILKNYNLVGLTHILAISGFNITLIINIFALIFSVLAKFWKIILTVSAIILFSLVTGFSASVVRASLMGIIFLIAIFYGRKSQALINLLLSACLMVWFSPKILNFDYSFQLSFVATLSLIWLMPILENKVKKWPNFLKEYLLVTLAAQILTIPIIIDGFESFSIISPLANLLVLPLIPWIMLFGFVTLALGIFGQAFTFIPAGITMLLTELKLFIVNSLAAFPLASLEIERVSWWIWGIYLGFLFIFFGKSKSEHNFH